MFEQLTYYSLREIHKLIIKNLYIFTLNSLTNIICSDKISLSKSLRRYREIGKIAEYLSRGVAVRLFCGIFSLAVFYGKAFLFAETLRKEKL